MEIEIFADGGSRGNPGPAAVGTVLIDKKSGQILEEKGRFVGWNQTNNQAEYLAVISALEAARKYGPSKVFVFLDSQLLVEQLKGRYKVRSPKLKVYFKKVVSLSKKFSVVKFRQIPRTKNYQADRLVNQALDQRLKV